MMMTMKAAAALAVALVPATAWAAGEITKPPAQDWSHHGLFGTFDRAAAQRGFQVYKEVCSSCHALSFVAYRNLEGIGFEPTQIDAIAAEYEVEDGPDEEGDMFFRPAKASDRFVSPFPNENAARAANNNAYPPDLSLMTKARIGGPDYLYALLVGYVEEPPEGAEVLEGLYYNTYFPGHQIAMAPPLFEDGVEYADGTAATVEQQAKDVVTFLSWAAQPELEERKRMGIKVLLFMIFLTGLMYALKRKIWADQH